MSSDPKVNNNVEKKRKSQRRLTEAQCGNRRNHRGNSRNEAQEQEPDTGRSVGKGREKPAHSRISLGPPTRSEKVPNG